MNDKIKQHLLFVINPCSGVGCINWKELISTYLSPFEHQLSFFILTKNIPYAILKEEITLKQPSSVIAVGGDGTIRFVAKCLLDTNIPLGIIPAGSANGLALELAIPADLEASLENILQGNSILIHAIEINKELCIHLSDIGLNAKAMKKFERQQQRGFWGYFLASLKVLWKNQKIKATLTYNDQIINTKAELIVIANSTTYGTGAIINPIGVLTDKKFEIVVVKIFSIQEIFKMMFSHARFDPDKTVVYQTSNLLIKTNKKVHFQIDGEYLGKISELSASIIPDAISIIVPAKNA